MVIVTTAVYWGLTSQPHTHKECSPVCLTFQHRAGVSPYTSPYSFARTCVFDKQSLLPRLCDPQPHIPARGMPSLRSPFSRSYGGILPSSLIMIHSHALVFSTRPPVSVSGTGGSNLASMLFSAAQDHSLPHILGPHQASPTRLPDLPRKRATPLNVPSHKTR